MYELLNSVKNKHVFKVLGFFLYFFLITLNLFSQKQFEVSLNIGKANTWAEPSQSKYVLYNKSNLTIIQYVNWKLYYTVKKYFQIGMGYNNGCNCYNFNFFNSTLAQPSGSFGGYTAICNEFNQIFIPFQVNGVSKFPAEPYFSVAPSFSFSRKHFEGIEYLSRTAFFPDTITWFTSTEGLRAHSFGCMVFGGLKVHVLKRFLLKVEIGHSYTKNVFTKAVLDYNYNNQEFKGVEYKFHNSFNYFSLGVSYKFRLFKIKENKDHP